MSVIKWSRYGSDKPRKKSTRSAPITESQLKEVLSKRVEEPEFDSGLTVGRVVILIVAGMIWVWIAVSAIQDIL